MFRVAATRVSAARLFVGIRFNSTAAYDEAIQGIRQDLKTNIRLKADAFEKNVIRSILTEVKNLEIDNHDKTKDEFQLYDLLSKMIKQRKATAQEYLKEGSPDRFREVGLNELREVPYLQKYQQSLPVASDEEVDAKVLEIATALQKDDLLDSPKSLFSRIPWKSIQTDWKATRSSVSASVNRVYEQLN